MNSLYVLVLAAGKGTRMKSSLYKVLHSVCGKPMIQHVLGTIKPLKPVTSYIVVGYGAEKVKETMGEDYTYVLQEEQLGTGHAVKMAKNELIDKKGSTLILCGDTPLLTSETLEALVRHHQQQQSAVTLLTANLDNPFGYGRIIREADGQISGIVEEKDASPEQRDIKEINTGVYCFNNQLLWKAMDQLSNQNAQNEYYLTDAIRILHQQGQKVVTFETNDIDQTLGVNDRVALAEAEQIMRQRINKYHMQQGVTLIDPQQTYIGPDVEIGQDTIIYPGTIISGPSRIGDSCIIGPQSELNQVNVGHHTEIKHSVVAESGIGDETTVGPFAYIRPGTKIGNQCRIGDFVELKNAQVSHGAKIPHLSYVGDALIGAGANIGCGAITVNYDGINKHKTIVEDGSFIGCNVNLVAPVTIGKDSFVAAGSTITDSVPKESFAIARQRQITKENYASKLKQKKK
jgi:bifunctional UDP-N-acetylglucosamine pyrophosphorylase/glucosamine-1-phosphate N-acetyltransferase